MGELVLAGRRKSPMQLLQLFFDLANKPLFVILGLRALEELIRWWVSRRQFNIMRLQVLRQSDEVDSEVIQGCLLSLEQLVGMGRVEKRTLFTKSLLEVLGGNRYLVKELRRASESCRHRSRNCLVMRYLPEDSKYHILQACLNECSSIFGPNFVHFNALDGENSNLFKSTWYCLTVTTPTRPETKRPDRRRSTQTSTGDKTCTFTDMTRMPRGTLRVTLVNESELRRVSDGKLRPPSWGFFNDRHAERFRMITDFARNFQKQLVRTSTDSRSISSRSPFTSDKVHSKSESKPDGGLMKRVSSVPNMSQMSRNRSASSKDNLSSLGKESALGARAESTEFAVRGKASREEKWEQTDGHEDMDGISENNCFLRLHVPHFLGQKEAARQPSLGDMQSKSLQGDAHSQAQLNRQPSSGNLSSGNLRAKSSSGDLQAQASLTLAPKTSRHSRQHSLSG